MLYLIISGKKGSFR